MSRKHAQKLATKRRYHAFVRFLGGTDADTLSIKSCKFFLRERGYSLNDYRKVVHSETPVADLNARSPSQAVMVAKKPAHPEVEARPSIETVIREEKASDEQRLKEFYDSWAWKRISYETRQRYERRCMCCGATPEKHGVRLVCDHIKPIRRHWHLRLDPGNLQVLCDDCNRGKGSHDETDWRSG